MQKKSKIEKVNITIKFCIFKLVYSITKFRVKLTLLNFWIKLTQKGYFRTKKKKENYHQILHIQINLDSFQLQLTILIFGTNFLIKSILPVENKKKNEHH